MKKGVPVKKKMVAKSKKVTTIANKTVAKKLKTPKKPAYKVGAATLKLTKLDRPPKGVKKRKSSKSKLGKKKYKKITKR